ncbi:hypothetical protein Nepgr_030919 [Nepenthes gracilis]|uniref:Uncharacterized protein n=1 Tax=Nepenthes gracilis TaxID=150966 RepID=A0AAD3THH7_NEPGR|nr:hypothetical protein Nepgr_030919 [Nepenthes gracilis]
MGLESFVIDSDFLPRSHLVDVALPSDEASSFSDVPASALSSLGQIAVSFEPQDEPQDGSIRGKASPIDPAEDEGPPIRARSRLENHETSTDSTNLDGPLQKDVPKAHSQIRGKGSSIR